MDGNFNVLEKPSLVFGGISETFNHATQTENYLNGKNLKDLTTLQGALSTLKDEVVPNNDPVMATPEYRAHLVQALFYRVTHKNHYETLKSLRTSLLEIW